MPNISILWDHGVPECFISKEIIKHPTTLSLSPDRFSEIVKAVDGMGFNHSTYMFVLAVLVMASMGKSKWERKMEVCRSLGWSDDEIISAFKRQPFFMTASEKKIKGNS